MILLEKDISAAEVARRAGVSRSAVTHTMKGVVKSKKIRKVISEIVEIPIEELWPANGNGQKPNNGCK